MKPSRYIFPLMLLLTAAALAQTNPVPLINNPLVPDAAAPGGASFTLTVNGTGFVSSSVVNWNGSALATTFVSNSQLTATVPAGNIATASTASVTVVSPAPGGGTANVDFFDVRQPFGAVSFDLSSDAAGSYYPAFVAAADLNGDGHLDLVSSGNGGISILLGNGDGTFQAAVSYASGLPGPVAIADFNGDGKLDLAFVDQSDGNAAIMLGNGDGTFRPAQEFPVTGGAACCLAAGDFNADGKLDLAIGLVTGQVAIALGNGDGTFQSSVDYSAGSGNIFSMAANDFNGDGKVDLAVVANPDQAISILLGNGDGSFQNGVEYATALGPVWLTTADLNGDGNVDLAVTTRDSIPPVISVLLGNGNGTFQNHVDYSTGGAPDGIIAADLNGDGKQDLAAANFFSNSICVFLGDGDGTFPLPNTFAGGTNPSGLAVGDFNGDGMLDLATAQGNGAQPSISVLLQATSVLSRTTIDFGNVQVGKNSHSMNVILTNIGTRSFAIKMILLAGTDPSDFTETHSCGPSLAPRTSCTIGLTFRPLTTGPLSATVTLKDTGINHPQTITLHGTGTQ